MANLFNEVLTKQAAHNASPSGERINGGIFKAIVITQNKVGDNFIDPIGQGRVAAYIPSMPGSSPEKPFIFKHASTSSIFSVPDKQGTTILVFFANEGNATEGYWFAISENVVDVVSGGVKGNPHIDGSGMGEGLFTDVPVMKDYETLEDVDTASEEIKNSDRNKIIGDQGTFTDDLRGPTTSNPRRDAGYKTKDGKQATQHSKVMGFKTSGGSAVSIDDGSIEPDDTIHPEQIRVTTSSGAGIILDGGNDFIYVVNSSGTGWIEVGANGEVMVYGEGSISMRTEKDFNIRADKNINLEAKENIHLHSIEGNTKINSDKEIHLRSKGNQFLQSESGMNINVGVNCVVTTGGLLHLNGPLAPESELILVGPPMPDMQDLENTEIKNTILSEIPTHEPFIRPHANELSTSKFASDSAIEAKKIWAQIQAGNLPKI
jgi:hypothetical protein